MIMSSRPEWSLRAFAAKLRGFLGNIAGPIATDSFNQTAAQIGTLADTTYLRLRCDAGGSLPA